jgi:hypothetical protein
VACNSIRARIHLASSIPDSRKVLLCHYWARIDQFAKLDDSFTHSFSICLGLLSDNFAVVKEDSS